MLLKLCSESQKEKNLNFKIQNYISRTHEMKKQNTVKNKGCLFFLLSKILPEYYTMFARKIFFLPNFLGGTALSAPSSF